MTVPKLLRMRKQSKVMKCVWLGAQESWRHCQRISEGKYSRTLVALGRRIIAKIEQVNISRQSSQAEAGGRDSTLYVLTESVWLAYIRIGQNFFSSPIY